MGNNAKTLMIQGTGSGVGKSLIVAGLCRYFANKGVKVAPFKAQNMALNSFITIDGGEIGRAQALQAEAARVAPVIDMNPVLLKASGEMGSQVIIHGKAIGHMKPMQYYANKKEVWKAVKKSFDRLSKDYELIIIEGAGSPAEINLMHADIVNMSVAKLANSPVLIIGDIDKGGVFASLYGTTRLLGKQSRYIKAFIINKFRGDIDILKPGLKMIEQKTGKPVIGVIPYIHDIGLPEEDGLALSRNTFSIKPIMDNVNNGKIKIVIVRLKFISNFTDFDPFFYEPDVDVSYSLRTNEIENADIVILPGTKNTIKDLLFLRDNNLDISIKKAYAKGSQIIGICGGYQMLGRSISDPHSVESHHKKVEAIGLLDIETIFKQNKTTSQVVAELNMLNGEPVFSTPLLYKQHISILKLRGYEIHMGISTGDINLFRLKRLSSSEDVYHLDGSQNGNCWGTYIHGIFENDIFRRGIIDSIRQMKGLTPLKFTYNYHQIKEDALDNLSNIISKNLDMDFIKGALE